MAAGKTKSGAAQYTAIKVRLYPSPEQAELIEKTFGCCRYLWNQMLSDVREFYAAADRQYIPTPARYKKGAPFLAEVDSQCLCAVHQDLRRAFQDFFRNPTASRYPKFKAKKDRRDSFTSYCRQFPSGPTVYLTGGGIRLPKLGVVPARIHRRPLHWWSLVSATVSRTRSGKYFCSILFRHPAKTPEPVPPEKTLELNGFPVRFCADGGGNAPARPGWMGRSEEKLVRARRKLDRMRPGSKHYEAQLQKLRLLREHIVNQRKDFVHKESRRIANAWDAVYVPERTLKSGNGGGMFCACLKYKLERQGKQYISYERRDRAEYAPCFAAAVK